MTRKMEARLHARPSAKRSRYRRVVAILAPAFAFAAALPAPAYALTLQEQGWQVANSKCQAGDDKQCTLRDRLGASLKRKGCTFQEDGGWWKCSRAH
jgi:hypothetical protein